MASQRECKWFNEWKGGTFVGPRTDRGGDVDVSYTTHRNGSGDGEIVTLDANRREGSCGRMSFCMFLQRCRILGWEGEGEGRR